MFLEYSLFYRYIIVILIVVILMPCKIYVPIFSYFNLCQSGLVSTSEMNNLYRNESKLCSEKLFNHQLKETVKPKEETRLTDLTQKHSFYIPAIFPANSS